MKSTSVRLYQRLLWIYPRRFRDEYEHEMVLLFCDCCREVQQRAGRKALLALLARTLIDVTISGIKERLEEGFGMSSATLVKWGGLAAAVGGLLWTWVITTMALRFPGVANVAHRDTDDLLPFMGGALLLIGLGTLSLFVHYRSRVDTVGQVGAVMGIVGTLLCQVVSMLRPASIEAGWYIFIIGWLLLLIGMTLLPLSMLAQRIGPWQAVVFLLLASLLIFGFNTEDNRAWLGLPFGAAWAWLGLLLWRRRAETSRL